MELKKTIFKNFKYFFLFTYSFFLIKGELKKNQLLKKIYLIHSDFIQKKKIINSDILFLKGNVTFQHEGNILSCDNAIFYEKFNKVKGFKKIKIQSKNRKIIGEKLEYNGNNGIAKIYQNPIMYEKKTKIQADTLYYDSQTKISKAIGNVLLTNKKIYIKSPIIEYNSNKLKAYYNNGGIIYDEKNTLKNLKGIYFLQKKKIEFLSNVSIENQEYKIISNKAHYYIDEKKIIFFGPTIIKNKLKPQEYIYTEKGKYYTREKKSYGEKLSSLHYDKKILKGDSLYFDQKIGFGSATGNVFLEDSEKKRFLIGGYGEVYKLFDSVMLTKKPLGIKIIKNDPIFIHSDTILLKKIPEFGNVIYAYNFVKIYKSDVQAKCDSIIYFENKNQINFYKNPIFWFKNQQILGDTIQAYIHPKKEIIDYIKIIGNTFLSSEVNIFNKKKFNQIKGNLIDIYFKNNKIDSIEIKKNVESILFSEEKKKNIFNIKKSYCGLIIAWFNLEQKIKKISCRKKVHSIFFSEKKTSKKKYFLSNFQWKYKERPIKEKEPLFNQVLFYYEEQNREKKSIENLEKNILLSI